MLETGIPLAGYEQSAFAFTQRFELDMVAPFNRFVHNLNNNNGQHHMFNAFLSHFY